MKNNTIKKAILSKLAVVAFTIMTFSTHGNPTHHQANMDSIINVFIPAEKILAGFVSSNNNTPYNTFVVELNSILHDFQRKIDAVTRSAHDELSVEIDELMDYVAQHFNVLCNILKKYNGKPATCAFEFAAEIQRDFDTKKIFSTMIAKLKTLRAKAVHADNKHLVKRIDYLAQLIQKKNTEWDAKNKMTLLTGLSNRMNCR